MIERWFVSLASRSLAAILSLLCQFGLVPLLPVTVQAEDASAVRSLRAILPTHLHSIFPSDVQILIGRNAIETFLADLDRVPPDWATVYGQGHNDPGHDERLFKLNRERDALREGNPALVRRVAFVWSGELSRFDPETQAYGVAIGPEFNSTSWGLVRFKPEEFPNDLRVRPDKILADRIKRSLSKHEKVHVFVVMAGKLIPGESIIYDFSHDKEGVGLIMPVVRLEQVEVVVRDSPRS
ncbi:MAG: hypothetical protein IPM58_05855 [Nitrospira sp.]|nr:hypothetical protein [Nitrospira sp.]